MTGYADACAVPIGTYATHVKVRVYSGGTLVASETIESGATYWFSVAPGSYRVVGPGEAPKIVVIHTGQVVTDNIPDLCK